ncbi:hypothetical protein MYP_3354 [Sporocytophaga myxococcoides]|uniref:Uncharacterized protein n=2 Tax=Sporocytophaga myxococcoides TaxID=153721 RepID=A0A098LGN1_9BACT|nr:hypothetical protein MYP_3354 [Sporocytophaga myxococcoides]
MMEENDSREDIIKPGICDTILQYFNNYQIKPVIDNSYNDGNDTTTIFKVGNHIVYWKYDETTTIVKIDNQYLNLEAENIEGSYSIGGIRLYSINNKEIIVIEFYVNGCGGNCFGGNSLFYDVQKKTTSYFSYFAMNCFSLYDFDKDRTINLLSPKFEGDFHGPFYESYSLYTLNEDGFFKQEVDQSGKPYFIKIFYPERSPEMGMQCEIAKMNWFEKIK